MRGLFRRTLGFGGACITAACLLTLVACGSSTEPETELFFRFQANGSLVEYLEPTSLFAAFAPTSGQSNLAITGYGPTSGAILQIYNDGPVTTGTYTGYDVVNSVPVGTIMTYETPTRVEYATDPGTNAELAITISEITTTRVRGTFAGRIEADGEPAINVSAGSFVVQRAN